MRLLISIIVLSVFLLFISCSEENPNSPNETGKLVVNSIPSGARIYLGGVNTGKDTPDTLTNLEAGDYYLFLYLQYYDTAYFSIKIQKNLTTTKEITLEDGLPMVEILMDYHSTSGGDSVQFYYTLNQDVLVDSITVKRPIGISGFYTIDVYTFNSQLFNAIDQFNNPIRYYLPPLGNGENYYPRFTNLIYWIDIYGHKAYGAKVYFHTSIAKEI